MKAFPLFINVADRSVIVFGGGEEAAAKLRLLLKTEARVIAIAPHFEAPLLALDGVIRVRTNPLTFELPENIAFAYAATGDEALDARLAERVRAAGILVCAADQPTVSDFSTPALVDRDPVVVAIGTEGTAPVLARRIKAQVEFMLEPGLGLIARIAASLREAVAHALPAGGARRDFWQRFFSGAREQRLTKAADIEALGRSLLTTHAAGTAPAAGSLTIVGTGAGQADLLAVAGHQALDSADVVLSEPLVSRAVLELSRREAIIETHGLGATTALLDHLRAGQSVTRLVSGSGHLAYAELHAARAAGFAVRLIPGIEAELETPSQSDTVQTLNQRPDASQGTRRTANPARKAA